MAVSVLWGALQDVTSEELDQALAVFRALDIGLAKLDDVALDLELALLGRAALGRALSASHLRPTFHSPPDSIARSLSD